MRKILPLLIVLCFIGVAPIWLSAGPSGAALEAEEDRYRPDYNERFCPTYAESTEYRHRTRQILVGPDDDWAATIRQAEAGTEILLADGSYNLTSGTLFVEPSSLTIRGASGDRDAVVITGPGYDQPGQGLMIAGTDVTVADLTITDFQSHAITIKPELGASRFTAYNLHLVDIGTQHLKASAGNDNPDGVAACSAIGYTPGGARGDYNGAIDIHRAINWTVRDNYIYNIAGDGSSCNAADPTDCGYLTAPAIYLWNNSRGGVIERNVLVNNARNISLGLDRNHVGGVVRNNLIVNQGDVLGGIELATAQDVLVEHNTVLVGGDHPGAIELRASSDIRLVNNLLSKDVWFKGGNQAIMTDGNIVDATTADFASPGRPQLAVGSRAIGAGVASEAISDIDGDARLGRWDVGADHFTAGAGPEPEPRPAPQPEPGPAPLPEPEPKPTPEPGPAPCPNPPPEPGPEPTPEPAPEPEPAPQPEPRPGPDLPEPEPDQPSPGRVSLSDFDYVGSFTVPAGVANRGFAYGGRAAAFNPDGDPGSDDGFDGSLFLSGHAINEWVGEIGIPIPQPHEGSSAGLPIARLLQAPADITGGRGTAYIGGGDRGGLDDFRIGGLEVVDSPNGPRLHWTAWQYYNNGYNDVAGHGHSSLDVSNPEPQGPWFLGDFKNNETAGYLFSAPRWFADRHLSGMTMLTGFQAHEGSANSSWGPPFFAFEPPNVAPPEQRLPTIELTNYRYPDYSLNPESLTSKSPGGAWVTTSDGRSAIVTVGHQAGSVRYGLPQPNDCSQHQGYHGDPYRPQFQFYAPDDLAAVAAGDLAPHEVEPYLSVDPRRYLIPTCDWLLSSISVDPSSGRVYVVQVEADTSQSIYEPLPVIHVFDLK